METELGPQKAVIVRSESTGQISNWVVFLHGDSPFGDPSYQYRIARNISQMTGGSAMAILRPGYRDACGDQSGGERGLTYGDNYTTEGVAALAEVISLIRKNENPVQITLMGHSGGAALTALLAADFPDLIDQSILVACPCDLPAWRQNMQALTGDSVWTEPMPGRSPLDCVDKVAAGKRILLFVGADDVVAPPSLSEVYHQAARDKGMEVEIDIIPNADHESILKSELLRRILRTAGLIQE
ncbi:MAG: alpha/beta fold hydrolase [Bacteroidota bacterium]